MVANRASQPPRKKASAKSPRGRSPAPPALPRQATPPRPPVPKGRGPGKKEKKKFVVTSLRLPEDLDARWEAIAERISNKNALGADAIRALCEAFETQGGRLSMPVEFNLSIAVTHTVTSTPVERAGNVVQFPTTRIPKPRLGRVPAGLPVDGEQQSGVFDLVPPGKARWIAFTLQVDGDSMDAARPVPLVHGDIVGLADPEFRPARDRDIVAALIDGEVCLKRLVVNPTTGEAYLKSESMNPRFKDLRPLHGLQIQGVVIERL